MVLKNSLHQKLQNNLESAIKPTTVHSCIYSEHFLLTNISHLNDLSQMTVNLPS